MLEGKLNEIKLQGWGDGSTLPFVVIERKDTKCCKKFVIVIINAWM